MIKKKVAVIGLKGLPAFGGAARAGESLIDILKEKYDFTVYAVSSHTNRKGFYNGYTQIVFNRFVSKELNTFIYYIKSALYCLFKGDFDIIHIQHIAGAFIIPLLRLKYAVISTARGKAEKVDKLKVLAKYYYPIMEIIFLKLSNIIVVVSKPHRDYYQSKSRKPVYFIPNGVSSKCSYSPLKIKYKHYLLFAAGRIIGIKGCHVFLKSLLKLNYKSKVLVVGDLDQIPKYRDQIHQLANYLDVEFTGLIKNTTLLMSYIKQAKLFIFPSFVEAMSNMLLEVGSLKIPIICSDIPENKAIFNDDQVLFFKTGDENDLSLKIEWALNNNSLMKDKAKRAYKHLMAHYNWDTIATEYDKLYQKLIESKYI